MSENRLVKRVISGGQVGADIAGLRAAQKLGIGTGGWMPNGWLTHDGPHPDYAKKYGMKECPLIGYPARTSLNVRDSDLTIRLAVNFESRGELATLREVRRFRKPYVDVDLTAPIPDKTKFRAVCRDLDVQILNVAGNAMPEIEDLVEEILLEWLA